MVPLSRTNTTAIKYPTRLPYNSSLSSSTRSRSPNLGHKAMNHLRTPPSIYLPKMPSFLYSQQSSPPPAHNSHQLPTRANTVQTRYVTMLLEMDDIPRIHNILASFFTWLLLAGFVIFPGTFTSLSSDTSHNSTTQTIIHSIHSIPLLVVATIASSIGGVGMLWLFFRHYDNFVWLLNRIFLPGVLHSLAGLISTLVNVYSSQKGIWSVTARIAGAVTGGAMFVCGALFAIYNFWVLAEVKRGHVRDMAGRDVEEEGFKEKMSRPAMEPSSMV